jgi:hypothetical protein
MVAIDADTVAPYLGSYESDVLGPLTLTWEEESLLADAGEFQVEIRARETDEGEIVYFMYTPPFAGVPLELAEDDGGNPVLNLGAGVVEYTFEQTG